MFPIKIPFSEKSREFHLSLRLNIRKEGGSQWCMQQQGLNLTLDTARRNGARRGAKQREKSHGLEKRGETSSVQQSFSILTALLPFFWQEDSADTQSNPLHYTNATAVTSNPQLFAMSTVANFTFLSCNYRVMGHNLRPSRGCEILCSHARLGLFESIILLAWWFWIFTSYQHLYS